MYTLYCLLLQHKSQQVEVLQNLPSYKEYEKLDKVDIKNENSSHCNDLGSTDEGDKTLCKKIVQNLNQLSALKDDENLDNSCYYFQHWFFDNIAKKYYDGDERGNNYPVAEKLYNIVSEITPVSSKMEPCKCYESGYPDVWKEEKHLHDYFENHKDIKCNDSDKSKCEKYIQYVTYINTLFQEKVDKCCPQDLLAQLKTKLQELGKKAETPRDGGTGAVEAGKAPGSGGDEREKKAQEDKVAAVTTGKEAKANVVAGEVPKEKAADSLAQSAPEKTITAQPAVQGSTGLKPGGLESREEKAEPAKSVAAEPATAMPAPPEPQVAKPVAAKPAATKPPGAGPVVAESERAKPSAAKPVAIKPETANHAMAESGEVELRVTKPAPAKPVASKPETEKPKEIVAEKEATKESLAEEEATKETVVEEEAPEELVNETTNTLQPEEPFGSPPIESAEQGMHVISSHNTEPASNALPLTIPDTPNTLGTTHEELDSNFFRNVIMAIASSRLESSLRKKKRKKGKIFEHNYYEEYEKELAMYGSEETFLDSETDRLYLNYHPDQDSYY
ncbi:PIR protein [Plasmodium vivax]|uniref:VIR protein n=1 Tax=Plasmodium vivax TaxID=5855 RepID=A0A565A5S1_PLAVI|nr:PIR protein [Plasmodium vivax]